MTSPLLAVARAAVELAKKATKGPWVKNYGKHTRSSWNRRRHKVSFCATETTGDVSYGFVTDRLHECDADFIVHAREHHSSLGAALIEAHEREELMETAVREAIVLTTYDPRAAHDRLHLALQQIADLRRPSAKEGT